MCLRGTCLRMILLMWASAAPLWAHETDQFTVPPDRKFADLGGYFNRWAYRAIEQGVNVTNAQIHKAIDAGASPGVLAELQSAPHVTMAVRTQWPWSVTQIEDFERVLASPEMRSRYPGRVVAYGERFTGVYQWAFLPFDIRAYAHILFFSSTIKIYDTFLGTDKLGHFTDEGINYYFEYRKWKDQGLNEREAIARAVRLGTDGLMSESGMLGLAANADYSNGDIAANFAGFLFYRNLTEPMPIKGRLQSPMLARDGAYWKIADDVRPDSRFFARFISDHLDEALNPGYFDGYLRPALKDAVRARRAVLLQHYCDDQGRPRTREWFDRKLRELSTYWGIDYGHRGTYDELVSIGSCCFGPGTHVIPSPVPAPARPSPPAAPGVTGIQLAMADPRPLSIHTAEGFNIAAVAIAMHREPPRDPAVDGFGQTPLHLAAAQASDGGAVAALVSSRASLSTRDDFGRTPLHDAAASGSEAAVRRLIDAGADPRAVDDYGTTPLHLACRRGSIGIARLLLAAGASPDAANSAGATPLHEAASTGDAILVRLLLDHGASPAARDRLGRAPADVARAHGFPELAATFVPGGPR
jgi:ankyrin repeat protein